MRLKALVVHRILSLFGFRVRQKPERRVLRAAG